MSQVNGEDNKSILGKQETKVGIRKIGAGVDAMLLIGSVYDDDFAGAEPIAAAGA
jgi:hypothetical protein